MCYRCKKDGSIRESDQYLPPTFFPHWMPGVKVANHIVDAVAVFFKVADKWKTVLTSNAKMRGFTSAVHTQFLGCVPYCSKNFPIGVITKGSTGKIPWTPGTAY